MPAVALTIKGNNDLNYEKRFLDTQCLNEFKHKLEMITGVLSQNMKLELYNKNDKFVGFLDNETATLADQGVKEEMIIRVLDITDNGTTMLDDVPKYVMSNEKYSQREDSARKWKESCLSNNVKTDAYRFDDHIAVGRRAVVRMPNQPEKHGEIAFVGETNFKPGMTWVGMRYDGPVGKNDGSVDGHRYFTAQPNHGGFVKPNCVFAEAVDQTIDEEF